MYTYMKKDIAIQLKIYENEYLANRALVMFWNNITDCDEFDILLLT